MVSDALNETLAETFPPGARKPRHDGWTSDAIAAFLHDLAAVGVVDHAARAAGLSAASAYAFRNRRQGRAFAKMWDAILIHRARARMASDLQARAVAGCVSVRKRDGMPDSEYHYHDNRLAMAMLTRLDRLAERETATDAHLRALSEGLDDYLDCLADGGDPDAFVEARRPVLSDVEGPVEPDAAPPCRSDDDPELTRLARLSGCPDYRDVDPNEIDVSDIDATRKSDWRADQWVRAYRSGFMHWLEAGGDSGGPGAALRFTFCRAAAGAAHDAGFAPDADPAEFDTADLDPAEIECWTDDQLARAWRGGLLGRLPDEFWDDLAGSGEEDEEDE